MTYVKEPSPDIGFKQWNKVGDHPDVTALNYKDFDKGSTCPQCGKNYRDHGQVSNPDTKPATDFTHFKAGGKTTVCPGDYIYKSTSDDGKEQVCVIPEKMFGFISSGVMLSRHDIIVEIHKTELQTREIYAKLWKLYSENIEIMNTALKLHSDEVTATIDKLTATHKEASVETDVLKVKSPDVTITFDKLASIIKDYQATITKAVLVINALTIKSDDFKIEGGLSITGALKVKDEDISESLALIKKDIEEIKAKL